MTSRQYQYDLDTVLAAITLNGLKPNSEVRIFRESDDVVLFGIDNTTEVYTVPYIWKEDVSVRIVIHPVSYEYIMLEGIILTSNQLYYS